MSVRLPAAGKVLIFTARSVLAGESLLSVNPKSAAPRIYGASSRVVIVLEVPEGASLTEVTLTVKLLGLGSRSTPPLAVPLLSCTWKVKLAYEIPLALLAGVKRSKPPLRSATTMNCPLVTATPLSVRVPAPGSVLIFTARSVLAGESLVSLNPKSAAAKK